MTHMYFSARAEGRVLYGHLGRTNSCLGLKKNLLFPETRPTLSFTPDPKNFMDLFVLKFFSGSISIGLVFRQTVLL